MTLITCPLNKEGDTTYINSYRGIPLLPVTYKTISQYKLDLPQLTTITLTPLNAGSRVIIITRYR